MIRVRQRQDLLDKGDKIPFETRDGKSGFVSLNIWIDAVEYHEDRYLVKGLDAIFDSIDLDFKEI